MKKPKYINLYLDYNINIEDLSNEEVGELFRSLLHYGNTWDDGKGDIPKMSPIVKVAFAPMRKQVDEEFRNYDKKCKQLSENIQKRWDKEKNDDIQKDTTVYKCINENTNGYKSIQKEKEEEKEKEKEDKKKKIKKKIPFVSRKVSPYMERSTPYDEKFGTGYLK